MTKTRPALPTTSSSMLLGWMGRAALVGLLVGTAVGIIALGA